MGRIKTTIVILIIIVLLAIVAITQIIFEKNSNNIGVAIIEAGLALMLAGVPGVLDILIAFVAPAMNVEIAETNYIYIYVCLVTGLLLVVIGIIVIFKLKTHIFVLNMLGINKREISDKKALKELGLAEYKVREQLIDILPVFNNGLKLDERANKYIIKQIIEDVKKYADRTNNEKCCFTGMAPVPYTIYAGTFLGNVNVCRYFEFNRLHGEKYYELKKKRFRSNWQKLYEIPQEHSNTSEEVVLAISISHKVQNADLVGFQEMSIVHLSLETPMDNVILYTDQLLEYKREINKYLDTELMDRFNNLKRVHLVAAIPSCMSLEIGKSIGMGTNRMPEIVVYHYISSSDKKYPFGIYVSGKKKGMLVKR